MSGGPAGLLRRLLAGPPALRPPGARPPRALDALCLRCGRCVAACPYGALRPDRLGVPAVVPRVAPCQLCMRCPPACPSGALDPSLRDPRAVRMGRARVDADRCYAFQGILCRTCLDECPLEGEAIRADAALRPEVTDRCTGCGLCEARCPAPDVAIRVVPAEALA